MRILIVSLMAIVSTLGLSAQSISIVNLSNAAISPSVVVNDTTQVTITGAAPNALVTLNYTQNGIPGVWYAGYTDGSGYWQYTQAQDTSKIGNWTEQWTVGGVNVGPMWTFEIFDKPSTLPWISVTASNPNSCGNSYNGNQVRPYGPSMSIKYQIKGVTGGNETVPNTGLGIMMEPIENGTFFFLNGTQSNYGPGDVGTDSGTFPWHPPSSQYAAADGTFYDVPVADCTSGPYAQYLSATQNIAIKIGNNSYTVRQQAWYSASSSPGHGSFTNFNDISYNQ